MERLMACGYLSFRFTVEGLGFRVASCGLGLEV